MNIIKGWLQRRMAKRLVSEMRQAIAKGECQGSMFADQLKTGNFYHAWGEKPVALSYITPDQLSLDFTDNGSMMDSFWELMKNPHACADNFQQALIKVLDTTRGNFTQPVTFEIGRDSADLLIIIVRSQETKKVLLYVLLISDFVRDMELSHAREEAQKRHEDLLYLRKEADEEYFREFFTKEGGFGYAVSEPDEEELAAMRQNPALKHLVDEYYPEDKKKR